MREISEPTRRLSEYIVRAREQALPPAVAEKARQHILDTIAAMISGSLLLPGRLALDYTAQLGGAPEASVMGARFLTSPVNAALCNGMLAHADETDDSHAASRTHPGCAVVPAALAIAETLHRGGEALIRAVVLGYDVAARLNYALGADAFAAASRSTHSFGGVFGAGAAAASLFGFDQRQTRHVLSWCAQQASGVACNVRDAEHVEKAFDFGGMPARNGVAAATMVAAGMSGVEDVFSGERNFFDAFAPEPNPGRLCESLGVEFEITGTAIKKWPAGSPAQAALDALTWLMQNEALIADGVDSIEVQLAPRSLRTVDNAPMPDVNVQHLLAMLLIDGALTFESIHDCTRMQDAAVAALRGRITLIPSEELADANPKRQAIVSVKMLDGRRLSRRTVAVHGTPANPMTTAQVEAKASDLIAPVFGPRRAGEIVRAIAGLEEVADVTTLRRLWQGPRTAGA